MRAKLIILDIAALLLTGFLTSTISVGAAGGGDELYNEAKRAYESFWTDEDKKADRANWLKIISRFERVYREDPSSSSAVKAYYMAGKLSYHCYRYHKNSADFARGVKNFEALLNKYPRSSLADDARYYLGELYLKSGNRKMAAYEYRLVMEKYPGGDMGRDARQRLEQMKLWPMPAWLVGFSPSQAGGSAPAPNPSAAPNQNSGSISTGRALIKDIKHHSSGDYTRVIIYCKRKVEYSDVNYIAPDPAHGIDYPRLYVDIQDTRLSPGLAQPHKIEDGLLLKVRAGQFTPNIVRVVLDIDAIDREQTKIFHIEETGGDFRIIIDVSGPKKAAPPVTDAGVESPKKSVIRIVLDPGHGGKDPGAIGPSGLKEKDVALKLALITRDKIRKSLNIDTRLTRDKDIFLPLEERTAFANMLHIEGQTLFISIHANAAEDRRARGIESYILDTTDDHSAKRLAAIENRVSIDAIDAFQSEKGLIFTLFQKAKADESYQLALDVQKSMVFGLRPKYSDIYDHGVREAPFFVLMGAKMPCILLETSFISNPVEEKRLKSDAYLGLMAQSITAGIAKYIKRKTAVTSAAR